MPPVKEYSQKPSNFNLIKSLDLTSNLFQMQRETETHYIKPQDAICKTHSSHREL